MSVRYVDIIGVLPHNCAPDMSREQRTRKVIVGPLTVGLEGANGFKAQFDREIMTAPRKKREKPTNRYPVQFTVRKGPNKLPAGAKVITPTEALSLSWVPQDWLAMNQPAEIVEVSDHAPTNTAVEPAFAGAEA